MMGLKLLRMETMGTRKVLSRGSKNDGFEAAEDGDYGYKEGAEQGK